ncbi:DUF4190 domain-containing protein [Actinomadura kijaniata]|uniref:DUF4190 domain-containing protein n=1 Tax=Actinomadura kijaniata TaxID=46161 RepID=UPI000A009E8C|nr:DUF4190 domain-containing protein [Actinomadura kijaniata]
MTQPPSGPAHGPDDPQNRPPNTPWQPPYGQSPYGQPPYEQPVYKEQPYGQYAGDYGGYGQQPMGGPGRTNGLAIASIATGIIGLVMCGLLSFVAVVTGHMSLGRIKRTGEGGRGLAIAGLVTGYLGIVAWVLLILLFVAGVIGASNDYDPSYTP